MAAELLINLESWANQGPRQPPPPDLQNPINALSMDPLWKTPAYQFGPGAPSMMVRCWLDSTPPPRPALRGLSWANRAYRAVKQHLNTIKALQPSGIINPG